MQLTVVQLATIIGHITMNVLAMHPPVYLEFDKLANECRRDPPQRQLINGYHHLLWLPLIFSRPEVRRQFH